MENCVRLYILYMNEVERMRKWPQSNLKHHFAIRLGGPP